MIEENVTIISRDYEGSVKRSWTADLIESDGSMLVFLGVFEDRVEHPDLGVIRRGTVSYEYYWLDRWYNVFRFHEPDGTFRNFYCNINMPPVFSGKVLDYVDLDLDLLIGPDLQPRLLDESEYAANKLKYGYPEELLSKVEENLAELSELVRLRRFPFRARDITRVGAETRGGII